MQPRRPSYYYLILTFRGSSVLCTYFLPKLNNFLSYLLLPFISPLSFHFRQSLVSRAYGCVARGVPSLERADLPWDPATPEKG